MPMSIIPFENRSMARARLIKNARLHSMIELFKDEDAGSGQMTVDAAARQLREEMNAPPSDITMLRKLSRLPSYDVYSLRVSLREQNIPVNNIEALKLSPEKSKELGGYMKDFTFPLIREIYGSGDVDIKDFEDLLNLFRNPDVKMAREKLDMMAKRLDIDLMELPGSWKITAISFCLWRISNKTWTRPIPSPRTSWAVCMPFATTGN